jgi:hypothetical protein
MKTHPKFTIARYGRVGDAGPVQIGDGYLLPERFYAIVVPDDPDLPLCNLGLVVERGRPVCVDLRCERREGSPPITGEVLRQLPVATYTREATRHVAKRLVPDPEGNGWRTVSALGPEATPVEWRDDDVPVYGRDSEPVPPEQRFDTQYDRWAAAPRRRGPIRDDELRDVASVYRAAHADHRPPTQAVSARFGVSRSTAGRWIAEARRRGLLGDARPGMAGEIADERSK